MNFSELTTLPPRTRAHERSESVDEDMKKPCAPREEVSRDDTTVFRETDPLCAALDELCSALNFWYGSMNNPWQREDRAYRKMLAKNLRDKLKRIISDGSGEE